MCSTNSTITDIVYFQFVAEFNDTQRELQQMVRKFTREEIIPKAAEYDKTMKFPHDIHKKGWELGIVTSFVPEKYGI
jgi:acyl-CoA dehydrogenase